MSTAGWIFLILTFGGLAIAVVVYAIALIYALIVSAPEYWRWFRGR